MAETFTLKEAIRYETIKTLLRNNMTNNEAALAMNCSRRQVQRIKRRVEQLGPAGVCHGNKGRAPVHAFPPEFKSRVISLAQRRYFDFNFSHLADMLSEAEGVKVNRETLRQWLRPLGLGKKVRSKPVHRKRRKRSEREGAMLFLDGSPHDWFAEEPSTLILCTDDATGAPLHGLFQKKEDLNGCFKVSLAVFKKHGLAVSFYLDRASQFVTTRHGGVHRYQGACRKTQFQRAMEELGVALIFSHSPQARGRGERINGTFQDRLVAELRLHGIKNARDATAYLNKSFIPRFVKRFARQAQQSPAWRPLPQSDLRNILCSCFQRTVKNDNTISVEGAILQLLATRNRPHLAQAKVNVKLWTDGSWHAFHPTEGEIPCRFIHDSAQKAAAQG